LVDEVLSRATRDLSDELVRGALFALVDGDFLVAGFRALVFRLTDLAEARFAADFFAAESDFFVFFLAVAIDARARATPVVCLDACTRDLRADIESDLNARSQR
jgi:hypothetical protein